MQFLCNKKIREPNRLYTLIESLEDLAFLNKELLRKPFLAIDTEFRRTNKDNMKLALLQVNDAEETYLIDTLGVGNPGVHASFLFSNSVVKIFHSCKEDLEAIYSWTKSEMINIFDTQLANSFLSNNYSISYQGIVEQELGIILEKKETRSNWMRRPLTEAQLKYAALDVEYLIYLYQNQMKLLCKSNKLDWLNEDIQRLIKLTFNPQHYFLDPNPTLSRSEENTLLKKFNEIVVDISKKEQINQTLFFSKKVQKDLIRHALIEGTDVALDQVTKWRANLIKGHLIELLK